MAEPERPPFRIESVLRLGRALRLVWESSRRWTVASAALVFVQGILPLLTLYLLKLILDAVTEGFDTGDSANAFPRVAVYVGLMGLVTLATNLCRSLSSLVGELHGQLVAQHVYGRIHAKSLEVDLEYYENPRYFDTFHRAQQEAGHRPARILNGLVQVSRSAVTLTALAGLLFVFHWSIAVVLVAVAVPGLLVRLKFSGTLYRWERKRTGFQRQANYFDWLLTSPFPAKEIRLFNLGPFFRRRFCEFHHKLIRERFGIATRRFWWDAGTQSVGTVGIFGCYAFIAYRALQGAITIGDLAMYYQALQRGQAFLREFLSGLAGLYEDSLFLTSLDEFLALRPKVVAPESPRPVQRPIRDGIAFRGVGFRYPGGERHVLEDIDLEIGKGEMVALVGENGAGKTTLVKLLCRLYDPTSGSVTLDGVDLRAYEPTELRRLIGVVFQEYGMYQLRASENIWLGDVDRPLDAARIEAAARQSGAHAVIADLPHGYDSYLGKWFEDGQELSVGEWQKVALARAYLRGAELLVLDEPTSALDAKAEYEVFEHLRNLTRERSALVISHRFSTVRMADRIYVVEGGRIVETGSHQELMELRGLYARLFGMQASHYR